MTVGEVMLETPKIVGSAVGLVTGAFVLSDRWLRHRPITSFKPIEDNDEGLFGLAVFNTSTEPIVVHAVECRPSGAMRVSYMADWRDVLDPDAKGIAIIDPKSQQVFTCIPLGFEALKANDLVKVTIRWSLTSSRWLRCPPIHLRNSVGRFDQIRTAKPPTA